MVDTLVLVVVLTKAFEVVVVVDALHMDFFVVVDCL